MSEVKQIKLLSGEEILCDLVDIEWTDEEGEVMIIRSAYSLVSQEDFENGLRYYTFRPFMMHVYDPSKILLLNAAAVICLTTPADPVMEQYIKHIEMYREEDKQAKKETSLDDLLDDMEEADDKEKDERIVKFKPRLH